jgi:putative ABC transport system permease protein
VACAAEDIFSDSGSTQGLMLTARIPVALATLAVSTAMVIAESCRDQAVLAAIGAIPGIRRRTVGSAAFQLGLLAAAIAIPAGFVLGAAVLAGLGGLLLTRSPSGDVLLRPLP